MSFLSLLSKPLANIIARQTRAWSNRPLEVQQEVFAGLLKGGTNTLFGREHRFSEIKNYDDFKQHIPIRDYEGIRPYVEKIKAGEENVLWKGKPIYLSKTSGTTSGIKYIPITKESLPNHLNSTRNALLSYIAETGNSGFLNGKLIFISGSPALETINGIAVGRLSGIVNHHVPYYLRRNQLPTYKTNCIEDWETKVDAIVDETIHQNMTFISGIPPWVQMYFDKLHDRTAKKIKDIFPEFSLFVYGGVNYEPYRKKFEQSIGKKVDSIELYPASEGFIAYQDSQKDHALLLLLNSGIFYEFIPVADFFKEHPTRLSIGDVEVGINYAIILNTNAGLWGYSLGDTVKFVSKHPCRIIVTGRIKHYISAFGEHVISEEVEKALLKAAQEQHAEVIEFTVAPEVNPEAGELPYHEWFIEFSSPPGDLERFRITMDMNLQEQNSYYRDLIQGHLLQSLKIRTLKKDAFISYMKSQGKLGGQNKVPRLSNDRAIADALKKFAVPSQKISQ
jgi:hypothetical protein